MDEKLLLLPSPRRLTMLGDIFPVTGQRLIALDGPRPQALLFAASRLQRALRQHTGVTWGVVAGAAVPQERVGVLLSVLPEKAQRLQGYELRISPDGIWAAAASPVGIFYAVTTLCQLLDQRHCDLPTLHVNDWPDFPSRGVMLDISRDKVPTMETLFNLIDLLASWKINQLQLYTEHTFAYQNHPEVWAGASPMTGEEILALDAYCRERFIELVPNQNSFGHMSRWLTHERYNHLAECPAGCDTEWGYFEKPLSLCPVDPDSLNLIRSLMDELLPHFSSRQFNVGCDETLDLGQGRSQRAVAEKGKGRVYLDFVLDIYREVKRRGRTMQFWGDIIMAHPELVAELPRDVIALEWGYEAEHPFDDHSARFAGAGMPFYVCPGTSSWNTIAGRTDNALENLRNAAENGLKHGAAGYLITDWGDRGHWQPLPVSYLGLAYGAALAWACEANRDMDIAQAISVYAFRDSTGVMGRLAYDLGNTYLEPGVLVPNSSVLLRILQESPDKIAARGGLTEKGLQKSLFYIDQVMSPLINRPDGDLVRREFSWAADMLRHACRRGMWALGMAQGKKDRDLGQQLGREADELLAEHRRIWLPRNRVGGLKDSQSRLEKMGRDYR